MRIINNIRSLLHWVSEKALAFMPDHLTGETRLLETKYKKKYGPKDCSLVVHNRKMRVMKLYISIILLFITVFLVLSIDQVLELKRSDAFERPTGSQQLKSSRAKVKIHYGELEYEKNVVLKVRKKELSNKEKSDVLKNFKVDLESIILLDNKDLLHITGPLNLIERETSRGITLTWTTDNPSVISEDGNIDLINGSKTDRIKLEAQLGLGEMTDTWSTYIKISPDIKSSDYKDTIEDRFARMIEKLNVSTQGEKLSLPNSLKDNIRLEWDQGTENNFFLIFLGLTLSITIIYFKRFDAVDKELKDVSESIVNDLPEFINKLVLLLNAGLVVSTALSKIARDHQNKNNHQPLRKLKNKERFLYEELSEIEKRIKQTNSSMIKELKEYSQRSGVRELMRVTAIIADNLNKGSSLTEKLESESELLWISRKKSAEEKGRMAETKLILPMMILLIILIVVTIAPALMEM